MIEDDIVIEAKAPATEVISIFEDRDLVSAPVVDEKNLLLGRITIDDVVDEIREESEIRNQLAVMKGKIFD